ncbi:phosphonate ABC transporter, permease protein PhnE [Paracoccus aminophilus]|uniref:Phosphonates transport system permease protein n=1 Tax=Paracoccus aminophilus JCM 7686 TaxID=1367847 RepID=S5Z1B7_PARAH|nr:phosphonate ABC transporter, permease protein PhnE [Paracoccus aminophilus]AGT11226.1 phosphonates transport system permease protein [Paracoccus aminophilus JCM 7686]
MSDTFAIEARAQALIRRRSLTALAIPAAIGLYLIYIFFAFDIPGLAQRARMDNASLLMRDFWSYKTHVTLDNRSGQITTAIEGSRKMTYAAGQEPGWVAPEGQGKRVTFPGGTVLLNEGWVEIDKADHAPIVITPKASGVEISGIDGSEPWVSASSARVDVNIGSSRVSVTKTRSEVTRRFAGWELFFFTLDSPFYGKGPLQLAGMAISDPAQIGAMAHDFWTNKVWHHGDVFWALGETVLMAFLGTFGAAFVALPLAFVAARNFGPSRIIRQAARRLFDFLRGVDGLIWTIILSRAFGPGPLTGSLAILLTDTGSFGKLFSESLENIDGKQVEGLRSTGAGPIQRARWGVLPQVAPVVLSQLLYFLESNTRGATVIGAIVGGGIGLLLTQAIQTQQDWEHVAYYIILIVLVVMLMDWLSGVLRRRLIKG